MAEEEKEQKPPQATTMEVTDKNGKLLSVGDVVAVAQDTKAYQVAPEGRGHFDDHQRFVPLSDDSGRASRHLLVPAGIRGVVSKLIVEAQLSANFKIQVTFTPGAACNEGGYDPPVPFVMHFGSSEVEFAG